MYKVIMLLLAVLLVSCGNNENTSQKVISVSILPQKFIVEKIADNNFNINVLVKPGMSPATYEPLPSQLSELSKSKVLFLSGVPFERVWAKKISEANPALKLVKLYTDVNSVSEDYDNYENLNSGDHHESHHHGDGHDHAIDPHTWMNPAEAMTEAKKVLDVLVDLDKTNEELYTQNYNKLISELDKTDSLVADILKEAPKTFMIYHPALGHFAERYGLKQIALEKEGKTPSQNDLTDFIEQIKNEDVKTIFIQKQFSKHVALAAAQETGCRVIEIDPLSEDYTNNLITIAKAIAGK